MSRHSGVPEHGNQHVDQHYVGKQQVDDEEKDNQPVCVGVYAGFSSGLDRCRVVCTAQEVQFISWNEGGEVSNRIQTQRGRSRTMPKAKIPEEVSQIRLNYNG